MRDGYEPFVLDRLGSSVVGVLAPHTYRRSFFEAGGSARGAVSVYVGAGARGVDVVLVGGPVGSGNGVVVAGNDRGWGCDASGGVEAGAREWERAGVSR